VWGTSEQSTASPNVPNSLPHTGHKVTRLVKEKADHLSDRLGIRFALEGDTLPLQKLTDGDVIFDDPVVDNRYTMTRVEIQMGVPLTRASVGGPSRVWDSDRAFERLGIEGLGQDRDLAHSLEVAHRIFVNRCHPGRIVTAVFRPPESV
tara:strand:- start:232 stop:678 length:447 start_codon:yes stop_codon:yes gene_type:complete